MKKASIRRIKERKKRVKDEHKKRREEHKMKEEVIKKVGAAQKVEKGEEKRQRKQENAKENMKKESKRKKNKSGVSEVQDLPVVDNREFVINLMNASVSASV